MQEFHCFGNFCSYLFTDGYKDENKIFKGIFESGKAFKTDWLSSKHEITSAQFERSADDVDILVKVCVECDEPEALIYDADGEDLSDEIRKEILEEYYDSGYNTTIELSKVVPKDTSYEDMLKVADDLYFEGSKALEETFQFIKGLVKQYKNQ